MDNKKSAANSGVKDNLTEVKVTNEEVLKKQPRQQRKQQLRNLQQRKRLK